MLGQPTETTGAGDAEAWRAAAVPLAKFVWNHLVVRTDVWGGYVAPARREAVGLKSYTAPAKEKRGKVTLAPWNLSRHFGGRCHGHVIGLHSTGPDRTCRWALIDVDKHGDEGDAELNWIAAEHWYRLLTLLGFNVWLSDSNGAGGFHVLIIFDEPVAAERLYRFMRLFVSDHAALGLPDAPEVYPKQPGLTGKGYGNWARVPGLHHTRPHWSRFWSGSRWLAGAEAVAFILASRPDPAELVPDLPTDPPAGATARAPRPSPQPRDGERRMTNPEIALSCIRAIPNPGVHFDEWIGVGMALASVEHSVAMMNEWVTWSRQSGKHADGECERRWPTFGGGAGDRAWTIGTLIHLSRRAGHDPFPKASLRLALPPPQPPPAPLTVRPALAGLVDILPNTPHARPARTGRRTAW